MKYLVLVVDKSTNAAIMMMMHNALSSMSLPIDGAPITVCAVQNMEQLTKLQFHENDEVQVCIKSNREYRKNGSVDVLSGECIELLVDLTNTLSRTNNIKVHSVAIIN